MEFNFESLEFSVKETQAAARQFATVFSGLEWTTIAERFAELLDGGNEYLVDYINAAANAERLCKDGDEIYSNIGALAIWRSFEVLTEKYNEHFKENLEVTDVYPAFIRIVRRLLGDF